jgi:hypothetical protein
MPRPRLANTPPGILKLTLLVSVTVPSATHVTRILAIVVDGPVTTQLKVLLVLPVSTAGSSQRGWCGDQGPGTRDQGPGTRDYEGYGNSLVQ